MSVTSWCVLALSRMTWSSVVKGVLSSSDVACVVGVLLMLPIVLGYGFTFAMKTRT